MSRLLTVGSFLAAATAVSGLYLLGHHVEGLERRVERVDRATLAEEQAIQVLKAEWGYLNRPERLQELAVKHADLLRLGPVTPDRMVTFETLNQRLDAMAETARLARLEMLRRLPEPRPKPSRPDRLHLASTGAGR